MSNPRRHGSDRSGCLVAAEDELLVGPVQATTTGGAEPVVIVGPDVGPDRGLHGATADVGFLHRASKHLAATIVVTREGGVS